MSKACLRVLKIIVSDSVQSQTQARCAMREMKTLLENIRVDMQLFSDDARQKTDFFKHNNHKKFPFASERDLATDPGHRRDLSEFMLVIRRISVHLASREQWYTKVGLQSVKQRCVVTSSFC